jgi:WYL domain
MNINRDTLANSDSPVAKLGARWGQERRLEFIDYRLQWDGLLNRSDLTTFFGISVPQASLDLSEYSKRANGNLEYDSSTKVYRASPLFKPAFASSSLEHYLEDLLRAAVNPNVPYGSFLGWHAPVAAVPRPWRRLDTPIAITVVKAIRQSLVLNVRYQSFSSQIPSVRKLTPHALANDGFRWHVRAYCHKNDDFRDFLLSRILELDAGEIDHDRSHDDHAWHHVVRLVLVPHEQLEEAHRAVIELDYGMKGGESVFECRQALLFYALQQLGLEGEETGKAAKAQQITLKNRAELAAFLPRTKHR